jgi:tetratricopeptide (TPR) repeat protein
MPALNATAVRKLLYPVLIVALLVGCFALMTVGTGGWGLLAFVFLLLVPGRIQGLAFRDFFRGRHLFAEGKFAEAIPCFERFLARIRRRPALKHLIWLQWTVYTADIEAMALNNLGGAHIQTGDLDAAERFLTEALRVDPRYGMAYYNLYVIAATRGDEAEAERLLAEAHRLGYTGGPVDGVIQRTMAGLARLEGR